MVRLEGSIQRYLGLSTDTKPVGDFANGESIPVGSSFMETDTGHIYRFNGDGWKFAEPTDETATLLTVIYLELQQIRAAVELATAA